MPYSRAHKERRKLPFLKAFTRIGTISGAAKACRISRDAVHDWRRNDPSFERAFQHAKTKHDQEPFEILESTVVFFKDIVRPLIPQNTWPSVATALAIATANLKRDLKEGRQRIAVPSEQKAGVSLSPIRILDVAIPIRGSGTSAQIS